MEKFITWVVTSSSDPNKVSLTVKGALLAIAPMLMLVTGLNDVDTNTLIDNIVQIFFLASSAVAAVQIVFGLTRKIMIGRWSAVE